MNIKNTHNKSMSAFDIILKKTNRISFDTDNNLNNTNNQKITTPPTSISTSVSTFADQILITSPICTDEMKNNNVNWQNIIIEDNSLKINYHAHVLHDDIKYSNTSVDQLITDEKNNYTNVQIKNDNKKYLDKSIASISNNTKVVIILNHDEDFNFITANIYSIIRHPYTLSSLMKILKNDVIENLNATEQITPCKNTHILVIDDTKINQVILSTLIKKKYNVSVTAVNNGKEAIDLIESETNFYDIIFVDINMPILDGYDTTNVIRSKDLYKKIPIFAFTANSHGRTQRIIYRYFI